MINLNAIAGAAVSVLNPYVTATWKRSTGYTRNANGTRTPTYSTATVLIQEQPLSANNLRQLNGMNITTVTRKVYANTSLLGVNRTTNQGGDLLLFTDPTTGTVQTWLVTIVFETWDQAGPWSSVGLTLQTPTGN